MDEGEGGTDNVSERDKENLTKADDSSDIEINKPVKKLKPSRPLKHRRVESNPLSAPRSSHSEPSKDQNIEDENKVEKSDGGEDFASSGNDERKAITLKMGARNVKFTAATVANEEALGIQLKEYKAPPTRIVIKQETLESDEKVLHVMPSSDVKKSTCKTVKHPDVKKEKSKSPLSKLKKEPGIVKTERLSLPSTVRVTLVKEEATIDDEEMEKEKAENNGLEAYTKILTANIAEKENLLLSHQKMINEFAMQSEEVNQKLKLREDFIDSQQKVIDDLEKQTVNIHKVEKLENELAEKEKIIAALLLSEEQWKTKEKEHDSEKSSKSQQKLFDDLEHQCLMVKSDNFLKSTENNQLVEKYTDLEKEKKVLLEMLNSQKSSAEDVLKTVEALKKRIDEVRYNEAREEEHLSKIVSLEKENTKLKYIEKDLEERSTSLETKMDKESEEKNLLEKALKEKLATNAKLEKETSKLSEKMKDLQKNLNGKVSKLEKENLKLKDKMMEVEKELEAKSKDLQRSVDDKTKDASATEEEIEKSKFKIRKLEERLDLETEKSVELIKKLNFSEKLLFSKENDYLALKDQQLLLESKQRTSQKKIEEFEKDNLKFVEANLKVKCLEDEKQDLLKEIRKVSELQKKVKILESKLKKYFNFYKKQTSLSEHTEEEKLESTTKSSNLESIDIPDPKEIDEILNQISEDVTKHTKSVAEEVTLRETPQLSLKRAEVDSDDIKLSSEVDDSQLRSLDTLEQSNTRLDEEDGLLNAWRSRMNQTQFSSYPASSIKLADLADFSPKHLDATTIDVMTKNSTIEAETSKESTSTNNSIIRTETGKESSATNNLIIETETSKESTVDDVVVIPALEFKSSKSSNKKYKSSESDLDSEDEVNRRRHKSKKSKKKRKKYKSKKDEKESERSRERKKHRYRRKSRSITKSRSRTRSRSRNSRRTTLKEGRRSRSRSIHFREKIRNTSRSPVKGLKRARSPSLTRRRKPPTQSSSSHVSPNKRFQSSQKSRSRSPAVVKEANFALSQEIFSIIEKLQEAKTETAPNNPPSIEETPRTKDKTATKDEVPSKGKTEKVEKLPKNIVANYSSEFEEISDEEMTLAEDCLNELDDTKNEYKE